MSIMKSHASKRLRQPGTFLRTVTWVTLTIVGLTITPARVRADVMKWTVDGAAREAIVVSPSKQDASGKAPLIFAFHGHGDTMQGAAGGMRLEKYWPEAIVVYPQGLPTNPAADPEGWGWIYNADADGQRDVQFVDAMLATLRTKFKVDDRRIYATGFSNGAVFTYELWSARANIFAAFAVVSGRMAPAVHLTEPKPLLVIAGQQDRTVMFKDQLAAINTARAMNGASETGTSCGAECMMYSSSKGSPVITYIHDGGHVYPAGVPYLTVQFFKQHMLAP